MKESFEKLSAITAILGYLFLCGTLYLVGFWTTFDFDITTYVDILDVPKSFVFPMAVVIGVSALGFFYQTIINIHPPVEKQEPAKQDKLFLFLSRGKIWVYAVIAFVALSIIRIFSNEAFYSLLGLVLAIFLMKKVSRILLISNISSVYIRWLLVILICYVPPGSFVVGKLESLAVYNNEEYYKVSKIDYMTTTGGKLEEVNLKLIGKLGSYIFLTDSLNSRIVTINLAFAKEIEYKKIKKQATTKAKIPTLNTSKDSVTRSDTGRKDTSHK